MKICILDRAAKVSLFLSLLAACVGQSELPKQSLTITGKAGRAAVIEVNGRSYVDLQNLAEINHWSVTVRGNEIAISAGAPQEELVGSSPQQRYQESTNTSALSREFMRTGIEHFATMREWASTLSYAIQNGYQVTEDWVANHSQDALHKLGLASAAASTDGDHQALILLTNEFHSVQEWSDKLVQERRSLNTAKYAVSPSALLEDPLSQKIVTCGRFLAAMLGSANFEDNPSCH